MLQLKTIHKGTYQLLRELSAIADLSNFSLAGGTGLALQLGHRISIDLDFLTISQFDSNLLLERVGGFFNLENSAAGRNSAACFVQYGGELVKTDFLRHNYRLLKPLVSVDNIRLYSIEDIAAMKLNAVANRGAKKDFYDVYALLEHFSLQELMGFFMEKYQQMNALTVVKSLVYFDDAELEPEPVTLSDVSWEEIKTSLQQAMQETF